MHKLKSILIYQRVSEFGCNFLFKTAVIFSKSPNTPKDFIILEQWKNKPSFWQFDIIPDGFNIKLKAIHAAPARDNSKPMMRTTLYDEPEIKVIDNKLFLKYDDLYVLVKTKSPIEISKDGIITDDRVEFLSKTKIKKVIATFHIVKGDLNKNIEDKYILRTDFRQIIGSVE